MQQTVKPADSKVTYKLYGLDLETRCDVTGCPGKDCKHALDHNRSAITVLGISDGFRSERVFRGTTDEIVSEFVRWVKANPSARFTAWNGKFDFRILVHRSTGQISDDLYVDDGCLLAFSNQDKIPDAWLEEYNEERIKINKVRSGHKHRDAGPHSLKTCAPYYLGVEPFWEPEEGHDDDEYVLKDARYALMLTKHFLQTLPAKTIEFYYNRQLPWAKMLMRMELLGIRLDNDKLMDMWKTTEQGLSTTQKQIQTQWATYFKEFEDLQRFELEEKFLAKKALGMTPGRLQQATKNLEKALTKIKPFNMDSPKQLLWLLRDKLGLDTTNLLDETSTDKETLTRLSHVNPEVEVLLRYRKNQKLCSAFFPEYLASQYKGRIHPTFNVATARTGRLSCSNPNLQQVPGELHELFCASPDHVLITRDLSAVEPTVLAYYSEDPVLCEVIMHGLDFHGTTAVAAFDLDCQSQDVKKLFPRLRQVAKTIGLAVLYGAGANQVYLVLQKEGFTNMTLTDAKAIVNRIRNKYAGVWDFKRALDRELSTGAVIYNLLGRPMRIKYIDDVYMKGLNTLIQGSASDLLLNAALKIEEEKVASPLLAVHDELVCEVYRNHSTTAEKRIVEILSTSVELNTKFGKIPIKTEGKISNHWDK